MKTTAQLKKTFQGFTLIELIVVIAIIGVLAASLIAVIDPLDKINSANDAGVVSSIAQFGKSNDSYAATHSNAYVGGATVNAALADLQTAGESKFGSYTPPGTYSVSYAADDGAGGACTTAGPTLCKRYIFYVSNLQSKKNSAKPQYVWANGQGCFKAAGALTAASTCP